MKPAREPRVPSTGARPARAKRLRPRPSVEVERSSPTAAADMAVSRYVTRIDRVTGAEIPGPIAPHELLVHAHRDRHPVQIAAQIAASRLLRHRGDVAGARAGLSRAVGLGRRAGEAIGRWTGDPSHAKWAQALLGVAPGSVEYRLRATSSLSAGEALHRVHGLRSDARARLLAVEGRVRVLLTGATGFLGKEILVQATEDPRVDEIVALVRPETVRDPETGDVLRVLSPAERGAVLVARLGLAPEAIARIRFVAGDVERPNLGLAEGELATLRASLTHVIHCAASVAFDDPYESSFRANVLGTRNALAFSRAVQKTRASRFVCHVQIETAYVHGRRRGVAFESQLTFPTGFYNNYYELTKAMASLETERALLEDGLRVTQLLPSIVVGATRTGNNRGDTKVVNAPVNGFGRAGAHAARPRRGPVQAARRRLLGGLVTQFPADPSAELNLVPVDRVAAGVLAALHRPDAVGARVHLGADDRLPAGAMARLIAEELGVDVRLTDPTVARVVVHPLLERLLRAVGEPRMASAVGKLGDLLGGYCEWGQPVHEMANDVRLLGLSPSRPAAVATFRMLCRHNRYVQAFGRVRDADEVARRERLWESVLDAIEAETGRPAHEVSPGAFRASLEARVDLATFRRVTRDRAGRPRPSPR